MDQSPDELRAHCVDFKLHCMLCWFIAYRFHINLKNYVITHDLYKIISISRYMKQIS